MGLRIGRFIKKQVKSVLKRAPAVAAGLSMGPVSGALALLSKPTGQIGRGVPSIEQLTGVGPFMQQQFATPAAAGAIAPLAMGLSRAVLGAIVRLASALGIAVTASNVGRVGVRLWRSVTALARRHPGISILAFLTGLGLAADEAAEFLFWGQAKARRRRGRGISARDIRVCRRTMRKMAAFQRDLGRAHAHPGRRRAIGPGGVSVVRAG